MIKGTSGTDMVMASSDRLFVALLPFSKRAAVRCLAIIALLVAWPFVAPRESAAVAQGQSAQLSSPVNVALPPSGMLPVPFGVGERLDYDVRFSVFKVGSGSMEVDEIEDVRGRPTYHTVFTIKGGMPGYRVNDVLESWFDVATLDSRRFRQNISEGNYKKLRHYEIFPETSLFREDQKAEQASVRNPLDDGSFLYFVRTIPLEVGRTYEVPRYFNPGANPVLIKVVRKDTVKVPAGTFPTVVLQPVFHTGGIFSENGKAEVWISDDSSRIMVQMKSNLSFGSINLFLKKVKLAGM